MVEEPSRGHGAQEVALLSIEHPRQDVARHEHVRHQVHVPDALPVGRGRFGSARDRDAGVGAEDVDAAVRAQDFFHKAGDLVFVRDVACDGTATDLSRDCLSALRIGVGHDYRLGARTREPS